MRWNENLWPPSGYVFVDEEKIAHTGTSLSDLMSKLAAYRTRRGLPPGNPISEVNGQLCGKFPARCLGGAPKSANPVRPTNASLATRVSSWLRSTWLKVAQKQVEFVPEEEVKRRAEICRACPFHVKFPMECAACAETVTQISFQLRAGRDKQSADLKACERFGSDLRVDALLAQPQQEAPENCWKK